MLNLALALMVAAMGIVGALLLYDQVWIGGSLVIIGAIFVAMVSKAIEIAKAERRQRSLDRLTGPRLRRE